MNASTETTQLNAIRMASSGRARRQERCAPTGDRQRVINCHAGYVYPPDRECVSTSPMLRHWHVHNQLDIHRNKYIFVTARQEYRTL